MDAKHYNGSDEREQWPSTGGAKRYFYECACSGLVHAIGLASVSDWQPYLGDTTVYALAQLRHVMRRGRELGLIPTRAELEKAA